MLESKIILHSTKTNNKARIRNTVFTFNAVVWSSIWRLPLLCLFLQRNNSVFQLAQFVWQNSTVATAFRRILRLFVHSFHCLFCGLDYFCLFRSIDLRTFLSVFWWPVARPDEFTHLFSACSCWLDTRGCCGHPRMFCPFSTRFTRWLIRASSPLSCHCCFYSLKKYRFQVGLTRRPWQLKDKNSKGVIFYIIMTYHAFLSLWWFSDCVFPNCVDSWEHTATKLILTKPPWWSLPSLLKTVKSSFKILGFEVHRAYHRMFWWLPLCPFLFHEIDPFFPSPLGLWSLVFKKGYHMQRYTFGFVFLVATTSSNANRRHFLPPQSINSKRRSADWRKCVDFSVIAGKSVLELTSLAPFSKNRFSLGLEPKWRLFWRHFPQFKKS